jgi:phenylacetate-CoA ligase
MAGTFPTRQEIASHQLAQLRNLLAKVIPANCFYTQKFSAAGINPEAASLADFSSRFPFTSKRELIEDQRAHPIHGSNLTFPREQYTRCHQTSGTSGQPLRWWDTPESWDWMLGNWAEVYAAAGVSRANRIFFAFSFGPFLGFWTAFESALRIGCLCLPGGGLSSSTRLRAIIDHQATVLCCTPTYALRLAEVATTERIDLRACKIKTIIVAGEPGGSIPVTRERISTHWNGARVFDHHGMTEVGPVTFECPIRPSVLHVIESSYFAEIVDPSTGSPVQPGNVGELVLTTLGRVGSPAIRYRTGDLVKAAALQASGSTTSVCACARANLALEGGILGRADDMIVVRGVNIYPSAVEEILRANTNVADYRVTISTNGTLTEMSLQLEADENCQDEPALVRQLEREFEAAFALRVPVEIVPRGTLPRFEMKARRIVNA